MEFLAQLFGEYWLPVQTTVWTLMKIVAIVLPLMIAVAYLTWAERKVIGFMQVRIGPNRVGYFGLLQPLADGVKFFLVVSNSTPGTAHSEGRANDHWEAADLLRDRLGFRHRLRNA